MDGSCIPTALKWLFVKKLIEVYIATSKLFKGTKVDKDKIVY